MPMDFIYVRTVSMMCTSPNFVLISEALTLDCPERENILNLFVSGFFTTETNSPPRV